MKPTFAIITPSFNLDFERCKILCESLDKYQDAPYTHYLCVDKSDEALFSTLVNPHRKLIISNSIIPSWLHMIPNPFKKMCFSFKTFPVRGWILQQLIKLTFASILSEDVLIYIDSDVAFIKPFSLDDFVKDDKIRLFRVPDQGNIPSHYKWHKRAAKLLGIPSKEYFGARYIGHMVSWRRDNVLKLYKRLEEVSGRSWQECVCNSIHFSEYILYGIYVDQVLKENSGHYYDPTVYFLEYWTQQDMTEEQLREFKNKLEPHHIGVMISSKAKMSIDRYADFIHQLQL